MKELGTLAEAFNEMLGRIETDNRLKQEQVDALRESEERLRRLSDASSEAIVITDNDTIVDANEGAVKLLGYEASELIGRGVLELIDPEALPLATERIRTNSEEPYESAALRKDGTVVPIAVRGKPFPYHGRTVRVTLMRDLSEERNVQEALRVSEQQLREAQKMEAIGRLAAGVAHDFNNLLTVICGNSELLLDELSDNNPGRRLTHEIMSAGTSAASLTRQLLAFSRKQVLQPRVLDLDTIVADVSKMLRRLLGEQIDLLISTAPALGCVMADPGQLEQVIINLVLNARDAMANGGKLTIEIRNVTLDENYVRQHRGSQAGEYVMLSVSDTGVGMDRHTRSHAFEPFFTTKEQGKGTGLGLSTVYGIVKQSGGYIEVSSELGEGTTFKIYLPQVTTATAVARLAGDGNVERTVGSETILLIEDEQGVRSVVRQILERRGHTVLEAVGGDQGQLISDSLSGPIHLLLTDVVMPNVSGREIADRIVASRPETRVLYMSGYTDDAIGHHGVLDPGVAFIGKPFTANDLARAVREVLDGS